MPELTLDHATRDRYLRIIDDETHRLERIIGDLLDLARLEGGGADVPPRAGAGMSPVRARPRAPRARADRRAASRFVANIAQGAETVYGDPDRLEQALQNLRPTRCDTRRTAARSSSSADRGRKRACGFACATAAPAFRAEHLPLIFDRLLQGGCARGRRRGQRTRPLDRQGHCRAPRRHHRRAQRGRRGVRHPPAARSSGPALHRGQRDVTEGRRARRGVI